MISYKRYLSLLIFVLCPVLLFSCKKNEQAVSEKNSGTEMPAVKAEGQETESTAGKKEMSKVLEIGTEEGKNGHLQFSVSIEDFIECYNQNYRRDKESDYIQPCSEWYSYIQDFGKHKGAVHYEFTADKKMWTLPTITIYTPKKGKAVRELTVNFDDHSYTEIMYKQYEELCFYTLRVFLPDLPKKKIIRLYQKINRLAYQNIFPGEKGFDSGNPPSDLYCHGAVGVYPYFAYGDSVRMCIIPVTEKVLKEYKERGTVIHDI